MGQDQLSEMDLTLPLDLSLGTAAAPSDVGPACVGAGESRWAPAVPIPPVPRERGRRLERESRPPRVRSTEEPALQSALAGVEAATEAGGRDGFSPRFTGPLETGRATVVT